MWTSLWGHFPGWESCGRTRSLWVPPSLGKWYYIVEESLKAWLSPIVSASVPPWRFLPNWVPSLTAFYDGLWCINKRNSFLLKFLSVIVFYYSNRNPWIERLHLVNCSTSYLAHTCVKLFLFLQFLWVSRGISIRIVLLVSTFIYLYK